MGNFYKLPPIPTEYRDQLRGVSSAVEKWMDHVRNLLNNGSFPWANISKTGSLLSDIETRPHSQLQTVLGGTDQHHVQETERAELIALDALAAGVVAKTANATYAARTVTGTTGKIDVTNGDGVSGDPTVTLPGTVTGPQSFGGVTDKSTFEADGTLVFEGAATVFLDVMFPMAPPKTTGAGNPTLVTYNSNMRGYSFAVNDAHDFDPQEINHNAKIGATATWHVHLLSRASDGSDRTVKYQVEYAVEPITGALPAPTVISAELTIPAGTAVNTPQRLNIGTFVVPTIAKIVYARMVRIASSGTEPSVDPVFSALHFHYELDTVGSREILTK